MIIHEYGGGVVLGKSQTESRNPQRVHLLRSCRLEIDFIDIEFFFFYI